MSGAQELCDDGVKALLEQRQDQGYDTLSETVTEALAQIVASAERREAGAS